MTEAFKPLDPVTLSALIASRLCHDLINPVGAIGSGLEVLEEPGMEKAMQDAALDLIRSGGQKSIALLKFARLAYGAAGGFGVEIPMEEAAAILREVFGWAKAELDWRLPAGPAAKEKVKSLMVLAHAAADCVPRGGTVTVTGMGDDFLVEAVGPRTILQDDLVRALAGDTTELKPKFAPAYVAGLMARETGGSISASLEDGKVMLRAIFAQSLAFADSR